MVIIFYLFLLTVFFFLGWLQLKIKLHFLRIKLKMGKIRESALIITGTYSHQIMISRLIFNTAQCLSRHRLSETTSRGQAPNTWSCFPLKETTPSCSKPLVLTEQNQIPQNTPLRNLNDRKKSPTKKS